MFSAYALSIRLLTPFCINSVVTELTKHIKSKKPSLDDYNAMPDVNRELKELSNFFPEFMWVVRDFVLELTDEYGKSITSREYLEMALSVCFKLFMY